MSDNLPPLPEPAMEELDPYSVVNPFAAKAQVFSWYTADQMRAYATAAMAAERERIASWLETQRNDVPATGAEFAAAIRGSKE